MLYNLCMEKSLNENLVVLLSSNRLSSYCYGNVTYDIALERYLYNIELSKALYPVLSILEVSLRNRINDAIEKIIKQDWMLEELACQDILLKSEYKKLQDAKNKLINKHKTITKENLIAELSLGFWVHLCTKKYKTKLWHRKNFFRIVFADYPNFSEFDKLSRVFPLLKLLLDLRNRIFHHEIILNNPLGVENCYYSMRKLLSYISQESLLYLDRICDFREIIKKQKP